MNLIKSIQVIKAYRKNPKGFIQSLCDSQGSRAYIKIFHRELLVLSNPDDILHVLKNNNANYSKGRSTKALKSILGDGLITSDRELWRQQQRLIRPVMSMKSVIDFCPVINEVCQNFFGSIAPGNHDAFELMNKLTWRIILKTLFNHDSNNELDSWLKDILFLFECITNRTRAIIPTPKWFPSNENRRFNEIIQRFDDFVYGLIAERRKGFKKRDLLQQLIDAKDEDGISVMSDKQIRDEIITFLFAGHETISNTMTWTMILLAQNQSYRIKLEEDFLKFEQTKNFEELNSAPLTSAVIDEAMRLYPPVWVYMREALGTDQVGDTVINPKTNVVIAPFLAHRAVDFWTSPNEFHPERFLPENKKQIPAGAFLPFGLGPRGCIGNHFAGYESKIILFNLIKSFKWEIVSEQKQEMLAGITLRPINNIEMKFSRISNV